jgi:hypothetical protein
MRIELEDAINVNGVVIISSHDCKSIDHKGAINADVPLLTAMQSLRLNLDLT